MKTAAAAMILSAFAAAIAMSAPARADEPLPRAEHPRPDMMRAAWMNLNGPWQFEIDAKADGEARGLMSGKDLSGKIIVPFPPESTLSLVGKTDIMKHVWYRRQFVLPEALKGKRILLHFGAIDYKAWVWVNGQPAGSHVGGSVQFTFEITKFLKDGPNELVVHAFDDTASGLQPAGKQTFTVSQGCVYTRTTGIWQTVWLEGVGQSYVEYFSIVPDPQRSRVHVEAAVNGAEGGLTLKVEAFADGKLVGSDTRPAAWRNNRLTVDLSDKRLWEVGSPFLYDLKFTLLRGQEKIDEVSGYFGLREVHVEGRCILINGKRVFQRLILDQGFYPDGIWTAPSDAALKKDIELSMAAGYNGARLHQKVFEPRYLYWADKLGYLVWGEFPSWGFNVSASQAFSAYINEWNEVVMRDRNHPSIVGWCPFNETGANAAELQQVIWKMTRLADPTRPLLETSGYTHTVVNPDVRDDHDYDQNPATFKDRWMRFFQSASLALPGRYGEGHHASGRIDLGVPYMVSEFGGTFWGKDKDGGWGYGKGPASIEDFYKRYAGLVDALLDNPNMFGFCYTQLTDVEQEHNGLYLYDRTPKFDAKRLHDITARAAAYETAGPSVGQPVIRERNWKVLVGALADGDLSKPYRYTTDAPAKEWTAEGFDDSKWTAAPAPFGNGVKGFRTPWKTADIYLRQTFEYDGAAFKDAAIVIFHDEDTEVYVNGQKVWSGTGYLTKYQIYGLDDAFKKALKKGTNTLAVHTHQTEGGQYIDLGILVEN